MVEGLKGVAEALGCALAAVMGAVGIGALLGVAAVAAVTVYGWVVA